MVNRRIAIIPARGGSKRIPKKNIVDFFGKPLIAWTIEAALSTKAFDKVIVSTDSEEIASVANAFGAEVPFLREQAADDNSPVSLASIHALKQAEAHWKTQFEVVVQLMPNCPLRDSTQIQNAIEIFDKERRSFQISCFKFGWMNPWWAATVDPCGRPSPIFPATKGARSQDLPSLFCPTGAIWIARAENLKQSMTFYGDDHRYEPLDWISAVDIDENEDLEMAKLLWVLKNRALDNAP